MTEPVCSDRLGLVAPTGRRPDQRGTRANPPAQRSAGTGVVGTAATCCPGPASALEKTARSAAVLSEGVCLSNMAIDGHSGARCAMVAASSMSLVRVLVELVDRG